MILKQWKTSSLLILISLMFFSGCSQPDTIIKLNNSFSDSPADEEDEDEDEAKLTLTWSPPPSVNSFSDIGDHAFFSQNIPYGPHARHQLDVLLPKSAYDSKTPTSLVIYIHSGGFVQGEKEMAYLKSSLIKTLVQQGVAVASINYPFIDTSDSQGVIDSLNGAKLALQFLRYHHKSFNFTRSEVVLTGTSAGATMALWLGVHDDMADPSSNDPIERESTRVLGVAGTEVQATLDAVEWESIFSMYSIQIDSTAAIRTRVKAMYGMSAADDVNLVRTDPDLINYRGKVNILAHMDSNDPEIWVESDEYTDTIPADTSHLFHHPNHLVALKSQADTTGMVSTFSIPQKGVIIPDLEPIEMFLLRKLGIP